MRKRLSLNGELTYPTLILLLVALMGLQSAPSALAGVSQIMKQPPKGNLYVLAIGIDKYSKQSGLHRLDAAAYDAQTLGSLFSQHSRYALNIPANRLYDHEFVQVLTNEAASRAAILQSLQQVIAQAKPEDTFVFFYSGHAYSWQSVYQSDRENPAFGDLKKQGFHLLPSDFNGHQSQSSIWSETLISFLNQVQAQKQLVILDAVTYPEAIEDFGRKATSDFSGLQRLGNRNLLVLGSPMSYEIAVKDETGNRQYQGKLTHLVVKGLLGEADSKSANLKIGQITALEMKAFLPWREMNEDGSLMKIDAFFLGQDFVMFPVIKGAMEADTTPPEIVISSPALTRGFVNLAKRNVAIEVKGNANDASGIQEVLINGKKAELNANGDFKLNMPVPFGESQLKIEARDKQGNRSTSQLTLKRDTTDTDPVLLPDYTGKKYALFFAGNDYDFWPDLNNPIRDAEALAQVLKENYSFETEVVTNPQKSDFLAKIREYQQKKYQTGDQLLIFFATHGMYDPISNEGYLVAKNSLKTSEVADYYESYLPNSLLAASINAIPSKHIFVILDACYGGTFGNNLIKREVDKKLIAPQQHSLPYNNIQLASADLPASLQQLMLSQQLSPQLSRSQYIQRRLEPISRLFLTSGQIRTVADGPLGGHSPFANQLLETLKRGGDEFGVLSYDELKKDALKLQQEPYYGNWGNHEEGGSFLFINK